MRIQEVVLWVLVAVGLISWWIYYLWMMSLACAFGSARGNCSTIWPWQLWGESLWLMVLIPASLVTGLAGAALLVRSRNSVVGKLMVTPAILIVLVFAVFWFI